MILNAVDLIQNGTGGLEARMTQKELKQKILKEYLVVNVCWMIILKWVSKKLFSFLDLFLHYNTGQSKFFGVNQIIYTKLNSVALVRERTIPTERPPTVGEVSANFCGLRGVTGPHGR